MLFVFMCLTGAGPGQASRHGLLGRKALSARVVTSCANGSRPYGRLKETRAIRAACHDAS